MNWLKTIFSWGVGLFVALRTMFPGKKDDPVLDTLSERARLDRDLERPGARDELLEKHYRD